MIDVKSTLEQGARLSREATDKESEFLRYILLAASSIFGILISLHPKSPEYIYSRWVFLLSVLTLALALLLGSLALYGRPRLPRRAQKRLSEESRAAIREHRPMNPVYITVSGYYSLCEKAAYTLLLIALVLLCTYALCDTFGI